MSNFISVNDFIRERISNNARMISEINNEMDALYDKRNDLVCEQLHLFESICPKEQYGLADQILFQMLDYPSIGLIGADIVFSYYLREDCYRAFLLHPDATVTMKTVVRGEETVRELDDPLDLEDLGFEFRTKYSIELRLEEMERNENESD